MRFLPLIVKNLGRRKARVEGSTSTPNSRSKAWTALIW